MIISTKSQVQAIYNQAASRKWVLPCFCSENLTTTEAIFAATQDFGRAHGIKHVPIIIAITNNYDHRSQTHNYTHTKDDKTGLRLFVNDIKALAGPGCVYEDLHVMIHLDHIQFDLDSDLLKNDLSDFASIMYDASTLPFAENIRMTTDFVKHHSDEIVIEGACDEIMDATGAERNELTTAEHALLYATETGVDLIVTNLGTEHRATGKDLKYCGERAREIKAQIGTKIVLHGTSSVPNSQVKDLFHDGICKVNIWTALERDSAPKLFAEMVRNASKIADQKTIEMLVEEGYLTKKCLTNEKVSLGHFTNVYRQDIVFQEMKKIVKEYLDMWYVI